MSEWITCPCCQYPAHKTVIGQKAKRWRQSEKDLAEALALLRGYTAHDECPHVEWDAGSWQSPGCEEGCRWCQARALLARIEERENPNEEEQP